MRFTRTAIVGTLAALIIPAPIMLAETSSPTRPAGPISVELAKKCRDLASARPGDLVKHSWL
jgi:hypothetical protein